MTAPPRRSCQRAGAGGATETPWAPFREIASATRPEAFTSSTKARRNLAEASRLFGVPIACWTAANCPSRIRAPGNFWTSVRSRGLSPASASSFWARSEEHTSELQSRPQLVCRLLLEKKKKKKNTLNKLKKKKTKKKQ